MSATSVDQKQLFINNEWRDAGSGKTMEVINPATEEVIATVASADAGRRRTRRSRRRARRSTGRGAGCRRASADGWSAGSANG